MHSRVTGHMIMKSCDNCRARCRSTGTMAVTESEAGKEQVTSDVVAYTPPLTTILCAVFSVVVALSESLLI